MYGITFDSKKEAERYLVLRSKAKAGQISELVRQKRYELLPKQDGERAVYYVADFVYKLPDGTVIVEDVKGVKTDVYKLKKKLMLYTYGIKINEV